MTIKVIDLWWIPSNRSFLDKAHPVRSQEANGAKLIDRALAHVRNPSPFVVQAGARVGLWPRLLMTRGCEVLAFEPDRDNFACCERNLDGYHGITLRREALGERRGVAHLKHSEFSSGEAYMDPAGEQQVMIVTLDNYRLPRCDLVMLDVEGHEIEVVRGALDTLARLKPVVVLEENGLCTRYGHEVGDAAKLMRELGYELVEEFYTLPPEIQNDGAFHGSDLIFAHP